MPAILTPTASNLSVWLLPAQDSPENKALQNILDDLAAKHGKSSYLPHVTLAIINLHPSTTEEQRNELAQRVETALQEMKEELFAARITFDHLFYNNAAMIVEGKKDEGLLELQRKFHEKIDAKLNVSWFPHFSIAYNQGGNAEKEADIKELEDRGLYKKKAKGSSSDEGSNDEGIELGGYTGFKVGGLYGAFCGGLLPEKWKIFLKIEEESQSTLE